MMKGKGILLAAALATGIVMTSCEEIDGLFDDFGVKVNSDYYEIELAIPPAPEGIQVYVHTLMQSDIQEIVDGYGDATATVEKVEVTDAYIEIVEGSNVSTLNAIKAITTTISTELLEERTIASCTNNTEDATTLPMDIEEVDIADYVEAEEYRLTNYGELDEELTDTLRIRGRLRYQLTLNVATE